MLFLLCASLLALSMLCSSLPLPISGTFIDPFYDARLGSSNGPDLKFSCSNWTAKVQEMQSFGTTHIIFQTVHDNRFGSFYPSQLPWMKKWSGQCDDVVGAVLNASNVSVFLSCEFVYTEDDSVTDPQIMSKRLQIMKELANMYGSHPSFAGWYFASEAYLSPYFQDSFLTYVSTLSSLARTLAPNAKVFISPYGTRFAINDDKFQSQLRSIDVDVIAYQDEVGCVRDELPVVQASSAFETLVQAHRQAGRPAIWANVESFTWRGPPNNDSSLLIPASMSRILRQMEGATKAGVERIITFSRQGICEPKSTSLPWGPKDLSAERQYAAYETFYGPGGATMHAALEAEIASLSVANKIVGPHDYIFQGTCRFSGAGNLTDGITGPLSPYNPAWLSFSFTSEATCDVVIDLRQPMPFQTVAANFLQVSRFWYHDGDANSPIARNYTAFLPSSVTFKAGNSLRSLQPLCTLSADPWPQEMYDTRNQLYACFLSQTQSFQFIFVHFAANVPMWAQPGPEKFYVAIDEVIVR